MKKIPSVDQRPFRPGWKAGLPVLALIVLGLEMVLLSWNKWADPQVDFGRELYIPWQITQGSVLYRDIAFFYGPLSPYLNALLFKLLGTSLLTLVLFNIAATACLACLIYRFFKYLADETSAFYTTLVFITVFAFSQIGKQSNFNFVCPYTYGITHGFILAFLSLEIFRKLLANPQSIGRLALIGFLLGCVFLTKSEVFFAAAVSLTAGLLKWSRLSNYSRKGLWLRWTLAGSCFLAPVAFFFVYFLSKMPLKEAVQAIVLPYQIHFLPALLSNPLYRNISGAGDLLWNFQQMFMALAVYLLTAIGIAAWGWQLSRPTPLPGERRVWIVCAAAGRFIFASAIVLLGFEIDKSVIGLPWVLISFACYLWLKSERLCASQTHTQTQAHAKQHLLFTVLTIFSLVLLAKFFFNTRIVHYGFVLAIPGTLLAVVILIHFFPVWLKRFHIDTAVSRNLFGVLVLFLCMIVIIASSRTYLSKQSRTGHGKDVMIDFSTRDFWGVDPNRARHYEAALNEIERRIPKDAGFVVFPEGVLLNYWARRKNPTPYINFMPPEILIFGEDRILKSFAENKPEYFILTDSFLRVYEIRSIFESPLGNIYRWILKNYTPVWQTGKPPFKNGRGFGIVILQRRPNPPSPAAA